ncbi:MAG: hypothetical protein DWQ34_27540 [Planctomycetota bacterium]|nr:MAG: hypothetical protein DWQ34_27540 [Planctomycetota bacterium]REK20317.1 MAG: hypothetical protein DWQ41_25325 [Planctomycetota bacterium]REK26814.1 MAG: hypothetical protein DWQ45_26625 [Planctomycetota bacterium]
MLTRALRLWPVVFLFLAFMPRADAQEAAADETASEKASEIVGDTRETVREIAEDVDQSETAREASAGILKPIYLLAEHMSFSSFHWAAFALMVAGVVGFALQLVFAKLVVLSKMSLSFTEIISDAMGLLISLIGLVLTTQAAAENSSFPDSPAAVLSATALGVVVGFLHYRWGQAQEVQAVEGRRQQAKRSDGDKK